MNAVCKMTGNGVVFPCSSYQCPLFGDCLVAYEKATAKPMTNADYIRSMTDEEMATELLPLFEELCEDGIPSPEYMRFWLKQPYKEN